jgi:hypothetical protein
MKKLILIPDELRVDSFSTDELQVDERGTVQGQVTSLPRTCPECATPPDTDYTC